MYLKILLVSVIILSCHQKDKEKPISINQPTRSFKELKNLVVLKGDTSAYYELFYAYVDNATENTDLFYYSYIMAFKYHYRKAYIDVYFSLCHLYNIYPSEMDDITIMDPQSKQLAIECLKQGVKLKYIDSTSVRISDSIISFH